MTEYACKCLNIRIRAQPTDDRPPAVEGSEFIPVHVGDQGISAVHPELTLRSRTRAKAHPDSNLLRRHICLTCLNCGSFVYRIEHVEPANMEGGEGPVLPTDEWAEHEVLRTSSGWIELSKQCLDQESIAKAAASSSYSPIFRVILPLSSETETIPPDTPSTTKSTKHSESFHTSLPPLPPLFPPPPFTPSHPTFHHLSSLASDQSQKIRQSAEEYLAEITRAKVAEIERQEDDLRRQVQILWVHFREALKPFEREKKELYSSHAPRSSDWSHSSAAADPGHGTPVSIHDFVPVTESSQLRSKSPSLHRVQSALSASMATSSMRPSRAAQQTETHADASPPDDEKDRDGNFIDPASSLREAYKRDVNEDKDIATSLKYVFNMEEAAAAVRGRKGRRHSLSNSEPSNSVVNPPPAEPTSPSRMDTIPEASGSGTVTVSTKSPKASGNGEETPSPSKAKGKRKVTFDIKPDVVPIGEASPSQQNGEEEAIFDLDQETVDRSQDDDPDAVKMTLPLLEAPHIPARPVRHRSTSSSTLPPHLSSLRPSSLPAPSHMRALSPPSQQASPPPALARVNGHDDTESDNKAPEPPLSPREAELLRLVAADVPSHRNGWRRDSKAWQTFVARQGGKARYPAAMSFDEEDEDDMDDAVDNEDTSGVSSLGSSRNDIGNLATSLPISIHPSAARRHSAGVLSYQPKTSLPDHYGILVPPLPLADGTQYSISSAANRKAAYAERDLSRSLDPGALDFAADDEDEKSDDEDTIGRGIPGRGRQRALKILQARSSLPAEGMWRSLAT